MTILRHVNHCSLILITTLLLSSCFSVALTGANAYYDKTSIQRRLVDYTINHKVNLALQHQSKLKNTHITASTFKRVVLLVGQVNTQAQKKLANQTAKKIKQIRHIINAIEVGKPPSVITQTHDSWITTKIKTQLIAANHIQPNNIKVVTENSVVYLLGVVRPYQAKIATTIAKKTSGVKKVIRAFEYITIQRPTPLKKHA